MIGTGEGSVSSAPDRGPATLEEVLEVIDRFVGSALPEGPSELAYELEHLRPGLDKLELRFSRTAGRFSQSSYWDDEGYISPYQWVRLNCKMGGGAAGQRITVGQKADSLPASVEAMANGEIGFAHLRLIASTTRALDESPTHSVFDERPLLQRAKELSVREFARACIQARHVADPKGTEQEQKEQTDRQTRTLRQAEDGMWLLNALLDNVNGTALTGLLNALGKKSGAGDDRSLTLRHAWALGEAVNYCLETMKLPMLNHQVAHLQVTAPLHALLGAIGAPAGGTGPRSSDQRRDAAPAGV